MIKGSVHSVATLMYRLFLHLQTCCHSLAISHHHAKLFKCIKKIASKDTLLIIEGTSGFGYLVVKQFLTRKLDLATYPHIQTSSDVIHTFSSLNLIIIRVEKHKFYV